MSETHTITELLRAWKGGEAGAAEQLAQIVYAEMHRLASQRLRHERPNHTLQATALVHEAYLRLLQNRTSWTGRAGFFAAASGQMRRILVDYARRVKSRKRGGGAVRVDLGTTVEPVMTIQDEVVALDLALDRLEVLHPRMARIVELRFFGGLTVEETARTLDISSDCVERQWKAARAFLASELGIG